jgi:ketosteroid isomerase-like protein
MVKEVNGGSIGEPIMADNSFGVTMFVDVTMQNGERMAMTELAVYHVKDGKIVAEQFFV